MNSVLNGHNIKTSWTETKCSVSQRFDTRLDATSTCSLNADQTDPQLDVISTYTQQQLPWNRTISPIYTAKNCSGIARGPALGSDLASKLPRSQSNQTTMGRARTSPMYRCLNPTNPKDLTEGCQWHHRTPPEVLRTVHERHLPDTGQVVVMLWMFSVY